VNSTSKNMTKNRLLKKKPGARHREELKSSPGLSDRKVSRAVRGMKTTHETREKKKNRKNKDDETPQREIERPTQEKPCKLVTGAKAGRRARKIESRI